MLTFTQIPEWFQTRTSVSKSVKVVQSEISYFFSKLIEFIYNHPEISRRDMPKLIRVMNTFATKTVLGDYVSTDTIFENLLNYTDYLDDSVCKQTLGAGYICIDNVSWDIEVSDVQTSATNLDSINVESKSRGVTLDILNKESEQFMADSSESVYSTDKADVTLTFPTYPTLDTSKVWAYCTDKADRRIPIFPTLPIVPTIQNEISVTTMIQDMTDSDLYALYPQTILRVRKSELYQPISGYTFDDVLGFIPHIDGFTEEQVKDNIIKYPMFNYMYRYVDGARVSFMKHIEIDGELLTLSKARERVSDLIMLPNNKFFIWDYIVRRYLLERDILGIEHKYPLIGTFKPFMTLFLPIEEYNKRGYTDILSMAKQCVEGRVSFYQTRNPLIRKLISDNEHGYVPVCVENRQCVFSSYCTRDWCDMSCSKSIMFDVLTEKSDMNLSMPALRANKKSRHKALKNIESAKGGLLVIQSNMSTDLANLYAYLSMCELCDKRGSNVSVYHLRYGKYMNAIKDSWKVGVSENLQETNAFVNSSEILIISGMDYMTFKDFECQTLLNLIQDRSSPEKTTILILSNIQDMVGTGSFFSLLKSKLEAGMKE